MGLPLHARIRLPEEELVEVEGGCPVSVEPHCIAGRLPQLVARGAGDQRECEAVHLLTAHSAQGL